MTIEDKVKELIREKSYEYDVKNDMRLVDDLGLDSLDAVELAMDIEKKFEISSDETDKAMDNDGDTMTVQDVIDFVNEHISDDKRKEYE